MGYRCQTATAGIDDSMVMDHSLVDVERRIVRSVIGRSSQVLCVKRVILKGWRLVLGENTSRASYLD